VDPGLLRFCTRSDLMRPAVRCSSHALHGRGGPGAERIAVIDHGAIVAIGSSGELKQQTGTIRSRRLSSSSRTSIAMRAHAAIRCAGISSRRR